MNNTTTFLSNLPCQQSNDVTYAETTAAGAASTLLIVVLAVIIRMLQIRQQNRSLKQESTNKETEL